MSAIPNLPEYILHPDDGHAAHTHLLNGKDNGAAQVEYVENISNAHNKCDATETSWQLYDAPIENQRSIRVIVIGAGYSGVYCGIKIPERLRNCELVIYEKNDGIGGTWYENRYPGAACDIPSHSYQFSFNPKPDWSSLYAPSAEIREYIQDTAKTYGADRFIKLCHEVKSCTWDQGSGEWTVQVRRPNGEVFEDRGNVLISARGLLNDKQWPQIEGMERFQGEVMHSAAWKSDYDFAGKRIGVIGSGSSAIQMWVDLPEEIDSDPMILILLSNSIPKLQKISGAHLTCFIRSRTWISPPFGEKVVDELGMGDGLQFLRSQIAKFKTDPEAWFDFRLKIEADANSIHASTLRGTKMQMDAQRAFDEGMKERLQAKKEYYDWLRPSFAPGCRRLTPGPGFLEALVQENVAFIRDPISHIEEAGVVTKDDQTLHALDVIVCATGFRTSAAPPFPVTGHGGKTMREHWSDRASTYLSLATDQFPNHFFMLGPNGAIGEGSLTMMIESTGDYICKAIRKLQKENIKSMVVKAERVRDFGAYCELKAEAKSRPRFQTLANLLIPLLGDRYFSGTVYADNCKSWYRQSPQGLPSPYVTGLWPGSTLHCIEALRSPRWEDYEYEYSPASGGNQMAWLGNGWAGCQLKDDVSREELAWYLLASEEEKERRREWSH